MPAAKKKQLRAKEENSWQRNLIAANEKISRDKKKARGKKEIGHGKRDILAAKKNILSVKRKKRRQKKIARCTAMGNSYGTFHSGKAEDDTK